MSNKIISFVEDNSKENKPEQNLTQTVHKPNTNLTQTRHKPNTQTNTKPNTTSYTKLYTKLSFSVLSGLQKEVLIFLFNECKKQRAEVTPELTPKHLANQLNVCFSSVRTTIQRLIEKGFISREEFKAGRGGWSKFRFPEELYKDLYHLEMEQKLNTKPNTETNTTPSSSSIYINNNINTTTNQDDNFLKKLPDEWQAIDFDDLSEYGFTEAHLFDIARAGKLSPDFVQDALYRFAWDIQNNRTGEYRNGLIGFIVGRLVKGGSYTSRSDDYIHPTIRAEKEFQERKLREIEEIKRLKQERLNLEIQEWIASQDDKFLASVISSEAKRFYIKHGISHPAVIEDLKKYYRETRSQ